MAVKKPFPDPLYAILSLIVGCVVTLQQMPLVVIRAPPLLVILPPPDAVVDEMLPTVDVVRAGIVSVLVDVGVLFVVEGSSGVSFLHEIMPFTKHSVDTKNTTILNFLFI